MKDDNHLSAAEFMDWTLAQPEDQRHELMLGVVLRARRPTTAETCVAADLAAALRTALRVSGAACELFAGSAALRVDDQTVYAPDVVVTMGGAVGAHAVATARPVIVAEALSPVPRTLDALLRVTDFLRVPSLRHVLMADPVRRALVWHRRADDGSIEMRVVRQGPVTLDPPGLSLEVADCFLSIDIEGSAGSRD